MASAQVADRTLMEVKLEEERKYFKQKLEGHAREMVRAATPLRAARHPRRALKTTNVSRVETPCSPPRVRCEGGTIESTSSH